MDNLHLHLPDYVQPMSKEQVVITVDAPTNRILDGKNCFIH